MAHEACPTLLELVPGKGVHKRGQLGVDRLFDQLARSIAQDVGEWIGQFCDGILWHLAYLLLG